MKKHDKRKRYCILCVQCVMLCFILLIPFQKTHAQWKSQLTLGSAYYSGNIEKFDIRTEGSITRKDSLIEAKVFGKLIYSETNKHKNNEEYSGGIKFDYKPYNKFTPFVLLAAYRNLYKKIELRGSALAGSKYVIYRGLDSLRKVVSDYSISAAMEYNTERYSKYEDAEGNTIEKSPKSKFRLSLRPKIKQYLSKNLYLEHLTFYQPNLKNFSDYMLVSITKLSTKISKKIEFGISYEFNYESKPVSETVEKKDQVVLAKLTIKI